MGNQYMLLHPYFSLIFEETRVQLIKLFHSYSGLILGEI